MTHGHLNEEDVQSVAIEGRALTDASWRDCPECRERVEAYRLLFSSITTLDPERPAFDLETAVMARLPEREKPVQVRPRPMSATPIWIGSLVFFAMVGIALVAMKGYLTGLATGVTGLVLVTVPGIAIWVLIDIVLDHRRKLRSIGLS